MMDADDDSHIHPYFRSFDRRFIIKSATWTGVNLGEGSFCDVDEVSIGGVLYAGKKVTHTLGTLTHEQELKRWAHECQLMTRLNHSNVVKCVGLWFPRYTESGSTTSDSESILPVLVMEKLEYNLLELLCHTSNIPLPLEVSIIEDVANGLLYLHTRSPPIIHRDLKIVNVYLTSSLVAKICSLGSSCAVTEQDEHEHLLLRFGADPFTPLAPESDVDTSNTKYDVSVDVFSFGFMALCILIGKVVVADDQILISFANDMSMQQKRIPYGSYFNDLERQLPGGGDHLLIPLLKKCLSNDPVARPTAQQIVDTLRRISNALEEHHIAACRQAVKEKGSLDQIIMQAVMFGLPRSGKTSLKDRLMGKKVAKQTSRSTGVATKAVRIRIGKSAVQVSGTVWNELTNIHDATFMAVTEISNSLMTQISEPQEPHEPEKPTTHVVSTSLSSENSLVGSTTTEAINTLTPQKPQLLQVSSDTQASSVSPIDVIESAVQQRTINYRRLLRHLNDPWTLYITDAGGQPEFQELLPVLVSGPTLFFLVFPLHMDLHQKCMVEYLDKNGESTIPFEASFTVVETLMQSLASIVSTQRFKYLESGKAFVPKVLFVGTHKDKVTSEKISEIDSALQVYVKQTDAYKSGVIEFATESHMLVAVNNLSESDEDVEEVRSIVHRIGTRGDDYRIPTPYPWLIFAMNVNLIEKSVLTFEECFQLAKQCGIETHQELDNALWFLHNYTGMVRHFQSIPELRNIVIKDPQYIFDKITEMIVSTFTFERTDYYTHEEFIKKGIFPLETFQKLAQKHDGIAPELMILLLENLHIIAPVIIAGTIKKYFLPCALSHATLPPLKVPTPAILSLYIVFSCGYCPKGLFGSLVAHLMSSKKVSKFEDWELEEDQIYRNQVSFSVGPLDSFRFVFHPSYIRVDLISNPDEDRSIPLGRVCCDVRTCIQESIAQLVDTLHYSTAQTISSIAFDSVCPETSPCLRIDSSEEFHLAKVNVYEGKPIAMTCLQTKKKFVFKDDSTCVYWFNEEAQFCAPTSSASSPKQSTLPPPTILSRQDSPTLPSHSDVFKCLLPLAYEWQNIGVLLDLEQGELQRIKYENPLQAIDCLREMVGLWLKRDNPPPSWKELCEAVKLLNPSKAKEIEEKGDHVVHDM